MGLSRKLGGGSSRAADPPGHVEYTWSTQAYTMREILTRFQLPCVVKCSGDAGTVLWSHFRFDMRQPLLLHAARTVRKVHARSLKATGDRSAEMEEFGPPLAIPEDYDGEFCLFVLFCLLYMFVVVAASRETEIANCKEDRRER